MFPKRALNVAAGALVSEAHMFQPDSVWERSACERIVQDSALLLTSPAQDPEARYLQVVWVELLMSKAAEAMSLSDEMAVCNVEVRDLGT
jgi:hypothetical protein